jgi:two-component system, chemotaxis family, chemotaxis protein CheY
MAKILVVDDSNLMRDMIKDICVKRGHEVVEAADGKESVDKYKSEKPDMVFMDIIMGVDKKSGIQALKDIRAHDENALVVMCTSIGEQESIIQECVEAGAIEYIAKPFKVGEIEKALDRFLD